MENALIVSSSDKGQEFFVSLLKAGETARLAAASSGGEARRLLLSSDFDLVVINAPLKDEFGHELAIQLAGSSMAGVVLAVKNELSEEIARKVEDYGVLVLAKPVSRQLAYQSLKLASASGSWIARLREENRTLRRKLEETQLVCRAKCVLVQQRGMTEQQAHRFIEKQAMDTRASKREVAEEILRRCGADAG